MQWRSLVEVKSGSLHQDDDGEPGLPRHQWSMTNGAVVENVLKMCMTDLTAAIVVPKADKLQGAEDISEEMAQDQLSSNA